MGLGSPLAAAFSKRYQPWALVSCKSVVSAPCGMPPAAALHASWGCPVGIPPLVSSLRSGLVRRGYLPAASFGIEAS